MFSVIIPYYNKIDQISLVLKSLSVQSANKHLFNVIIIDDGSDEKIEQIISKFNRELDLYYYYLPHTGNRAFVRNYGIEKASNSHLIFLDSDMVVPPNFIDIFHNEVSSGCITDVFLGLRKCLQEFNSDFIDEDIIENRFEFMDMLLAWNDERTSYINLEKRCGTSWIGKWQFLYSHCFCVSKELAIAVGGFDTKFGENWGGEDVEFGYRLFKKNCQFKLLENIVCYHLYHGGNLVKQIKSLRKNYALMNRTHQHWQIELFTLEYEAWAHSIVEIQNRLLKREHIIKSLLAQDIKENSTILFGIDTQNIENCDKVEFAFTPECSIENSKTHNCLGINTNFKTGEFKEAIVSEKYKKVNLGLYKLILEESKRIAKSVKVANESGITIEYKMKDSEFHDACIFYLSNMTEFNFTKFNYLNLAIAASKQGMTIGVQLEYDPYSEIGLNTGMLSTNRKNKINQIEMLNKHQLNSIGDRIPNIMDDGPSKQMGRGIGKRILWTNIWAENYEKYICNSILNTYDAVYVKRNWEINKFPRNIQIEELPIGIEIEKINEIEANSNIADNNINSFFIVSHFTDDFSNIDVALSAFSSVFESDESYKLKIIVPNYIGHVENEYLSEDSLRVINNRLNQIKLNYDNNLNAYIQNYEKHKNIEFVNNIVNEEEISRLIYQCNCMIAISSNIEVSPLVLEAIAFGKRVIALDNHCYDGYLTENAIYKVNCYDELAIGKEALLENLLLSERDIRRYCIIKRPVTSHLKEILIDIKNGRKSTNVPKNEIRRVRETFNYSNIAIKFRQLISKFNQNQ